MWLRIIRWQYALSLTLLLEAVMAAGWLLLPTVRARLCCGQALLVLSLLLARFLLAQATPRRQRAGERSTLRYLRWSLWLPLGCALFAIFSLCYRMQTPAANWMAPVTLVGCILLALGIIPWREILPRPRIAQLALGCDLLITLVALVYLVGQSSLGPLLLAGYPHPWACVAAWASLLALFILVLTLTLLLHAAVPRVRLRAHLLTLAGLLLLLFGQLLLSIIIIHQATPITPYQLACWLLAYPCFGFAAFWLAQRVPKDATELQSLTERPVPSGQFLPIILLATIAGIGLKSGFLPGSASPGQQQLLLSALLLLLLLLIARYLAEMSWQEQCTTSLAEKLLETERLVMMDPLTGMANKRACMKRMEEEMSRAQRYNRPLALIFSDIDFFKLINDVHGHTIGDLALCELGKCLQDSLRTTDLVARLGGEEFVILLPETTLEQATCLAERLRKTIEALRIPLPSAVKLQMTISMGIAGYPETSTSAESLLHDADEAMSQAKEAGRNRVQQAKATQHLYLIELAK